MGKGDGVEGSPNMRKDGDRAAGIHVDVHQHLFGGGQELFVVAMKHLVIDVQSLSVDAEDPGGDVQRRVLHRFA